MIDSKDLRIGNLVLDSTKNTTKIESIIPEHNRVRYGIKLTEHWLERFGFGKLIGWFINVDNSKSRKLELAANNDTSELQWYVYFRQELPVGVIVGDGVVDDYVLLRKDLKYVHELQNLFYSLTGKEL